MHGSVLYTACDQGVIRRYRRWPDHHGYLGEVYRHKGDVQDMDISPYDECILYETDSCLTIVKLPIWLPSNL